MERRALPNGGESISGFGRPFGITLDPGGALLVVDMDWHAVIRVDGDTAQLSTGHGWSEVSPLARLTPPRHRGHFNGPHSIAPGPNGEYYVTTYYEPGIFAFDARTGDVTRAVAPRDQGPPLKGPATAFFDDRRRLWVAEYALDTVVAVDEYGEQVGALNSAPRPRVVERSRFDRPHMCRQCPAGDLIVADTWNHQLQRWTVDGEYVGWLGVDVAGRPQRWSQEGTAVASGGPGGLHCPVSVSFWTDGSLVTADWGNDRLQVFASDGALIRVVDELELQRPYDAQFLGEQLVVADSHNARVLVLEGAQYVG